MLHVRARIDMTLFDAVADLAASTDDDALIEGLRRLVGERPEFGAEGKAIAADPAASFAVERFRDPLFWSRQRALRDALADRLEESVSTVADYLPATPDDREAAVTVLPVPGLGTCYGAGEGRQVFGLYEEATADEAVLFCSHTYLHEVSGLVSTDATRRAEADPSTAAALRHLVLALVRNEGIANLAVLDEVRRLRDTGAAAMPYFDYAPLIDDAQARTRALVAARQLLGKVTDANARALLPKLTAAFKNPKLPVINLVGIHVAEAVAGAFGVRRVVDVDGREPQEFFQAYAETSDPSRDALLGEGMAEASLFGVAARPTPRDEPSPLRTRRASGDRLIDLSLGDPGYGPPAAVLDAVSAAMRDGPVGYAARGGVPALRRALAEKLAARNGLAADPADVVVTSGASQALFSTLGVTCRPGDEVLLPAPCFPLYRLAVRSLGLTAVDYRVDDNTGEPDWDQLTRAAATARIVLWNYPSNPLGAVARPDWTLRLIDLLDAHPSLLLASDEVYEDLCYDGKHITVAAELPDELAARVLSFYSFSKSYGMTGWRVGYVHAPGGLAPDIARYHWAASMSTSTPGQVAALAALRCGTDVMAQRVEELRGNRDASVAGLRAMGLDVAAPAAGLYCWFDVSSTGLDADAFVRRAAVEAGVVLASGAEFGPWSANRVRLSFAAAPESVAEAVDRLRRLAA